MFYFESFDTSIGFIPFTVISYRKHLSILYTLHPISIYYYCYVIITFFKSII